MLLRNGWGKTATPQIAISGFNAMVIYLLNQDVIPDSYFRSDPDRLRGNENMDISG